MFNSLTTQYLEYLVQAPDYHPVTLKASCISGCASGILPLLKPGHRVLVDTNILQQLKALIYLSFFYIIRDAHLLVADF